jgi:hypothetical protein
MKKILPVCLALAFCSTLMHAKSASQAADFSGNWVLDASQTKNLPQGLQRYSMAVSQDERQLKVQTRLEGDLQSDARAGPNVDRTPRVGRGDDYPPDTPDRYPRSGGLGLPGRIGVGMPGGGTGGPMGEGIPGVGMPGGGRGSSRSQSRSQAAVAAFTLYPHSATYKLDGSESSTQLGGPMQSEATSKADWAKSGTVLRLSLAGSGDSQRGGQTQLKDQWKLSKDRQLLLIDRAVHSPGASGSVHLVFRKQAADSAPAAEQKGSTK